MSKSIILYYKFMKELFEDLYTTKFNDIALLIQIKNCE
jgi:hypothetical protein